MERIFVAACLLLLLAQVHGHGRLRVPHSRSTLWRYPDDPAIQPYLSIVEPNYNDNELFCGGFTHQTNLGGKCGVCGDAWDAEVKENEAGGKYAKGIIVEQHSSGSQMTATVELTAHHDGFFEFRLCPWDNPTVPITHECLNQYLLDINVPGQKQYYIPDTTGSSSQYFDMTLTLPAGVECDQCVLQWRYHTGNTWDCDDDGNCCHGCGPQEEFYGCADIAIGTGPTLAPPAFQGSNQPTTAPTSSRSTTTSTSTTTTTTESSVVITTDSSSTGPCSVGKTGQYKYTCTSFYTCNGNTQVIYNCPPGTVYDEMRNICDYAYNVPPPCGSKTT